MINKMLWKQPTSHAFIDREKILRNISLLALKTKMKYVAVETNNDKEVYQFSFLKSQESEVLSIIRYRGTSKIAGQL
jgi:hypothetical protein